MNSNATTVHVSNGDLFGKDTIMVLHGNFVA